MGFTEEQKRYRNDFIMLTLLAVFGIMIGIFLYEYTDFFKSLNKEQLSTFTDKYEFSALISLFSSELKFIIPVFISGFTLFGPLVSFGVLLYKGFICGFSMLYFGMCYQNGNITEKEFRLYTLIFILSLLIYIILGAKSMAFSGTLKYASPDIKMILKQDFAQKYILTFLVLSAFTLILLILKYSVPYFK
ncbi:MAG: hypothetical protein IKU52_06310 [Clostridia bacterium]|nr:hypothetical protein [Clostridia bacterium]